MVRDRSLSKTLIKTTFKLIDLVDLKFKEKYLLNPCNINI